METNKNKGKKKAAVVVTPEVVKSTPAAGAVQAKVAKPKGAVGKVKGNLAKTKASKAKKAVTDEKVPRDFSLEALKYQLKLGGVHTLRYGEKRRSATKDGAPQPLTPADRRAQYKKLQRQLSALYTEPLADMTRDMVVLAFGREDDTKKNEGGIRVKPADLDFVLSRPTRQVLVGDSDVGPKKKKV
jgi:hypothetical protein